MVENDRPTAATAIQQVQKAATELEKAANAAAPPPAPSGVQRVQVETSPINISDYVMWGSLGIVAALGQLVLILFLVYFLLASGDLYRRKLVKIVGTSLTEKKLTVQILQEIDRQIEMFLLVQVFTSTIVGGGDVAGVPRARRRAGGGVGVARRHLQLDPVLRTGARHRRDLGGRVPAVRHPAHGDSRRRRVAA